ncbi:mitochondrial intermembrane space import and assembly protein 40-like [Phocoena sinus]|uniref:mitochondrial intermembrane space import and assembly protein 40-like n=1 Tax=Phocoena sinus TaxID=42100 RepID=UPI0013C3F4BB|nr:mitochondrial intermembrane space import and assembly protein 40-like [Phocoena sinus]
MHTENCLKSDYSNFLSLQGVKFILQLTSREIFSVCYDRLRERIVKGNFTELLQFSSAEQGFQVGAPGCTTAYSQQEGKDRSIFVTKEDHETPRNAELAADDPNDPYEERGRMLPHGDNISWNCPCLGGMASGPRGEQFKVGFSCFHCSTEDVKGSDCVDQLRAMQKYPDLYPQEEEEKPADRLEETAASEATVTKEEEGSS